MPEVKNHERAGFSSREKTGAKPKKGGSPLLYGLYRERRKKGLNLRELEELSGVYASSIADLENLNRGGQSKTISRLCEALGIERELLMSSDAEALALGYRIPDTTDAGNSR